MAKIGLFYGSTTGKTADIAEQIQAALGGDSVVDLHDVADVEASELARYDYLVIGSPTWDIGELQADWDGLLAELDSIDFNNKIIAYFGTGDQVGYADNFMDAIGILEAKITSLGGKTVGYWPTTDYDFNASKAVQNGTFCGLALDEDNEPEKTADRIQTWTAQIKQAMGL
jgi:flavodoxin I